MQVSLTGNGTSCYKTCQTSRQFFIVMLAFAQRHYTFAGYMVPLLGAGIPVHLPVVPGMRRRQSR